MKKLNLFQRFLISKGLELVSEAYKKDIEEATSRGKNHIFTEAYVDMIIKEALDSVDALTKKPRKSSK